MERHSSERDPVSLQIIPAEFALKSGSSLAFKVYTLDETGRRIEEIKDGLTWEKWIPPTAKVQSKVDAEITSNGILVAEKNAKLSAGALRVSNGNLYGVSRGRVLQDLPYEENFEEGFSLTQQSSDQILVETWLPATPSIEFCFKERSILLVTKICATTQQWLM